MADIHWATPINGYFDTASNWSEGVVPGAADYALIDVGSAHFTVECRHNAKVLGVQLGTNATLYVHSTVTATSDANGFVNAGQVEMAGTLISDSFDNLAGGILDGAGLVKI